MSKVQFMTAFIVALADSFEPPSFVSDVMGQANI
jgi:hypothetical protein